MVKKIIWTPEAEKTHDAIIDYLENKWSKKEVIAFIEKVNSIVLHIR